MFGSPGLMLWKPAGEGGIHGNKPNTNNSFCQGTSGIPRGGRDTASHRSTRDGLGRALYPRRGHEGALCPEPRALIYARLSASLRARPTLQEEKNKQNGRLGRHEGLRFQDGPVTNRMFDEGDTNDGAQCPPARGRLPARKSPRGKRQTLLRLDV